VRGIASFFPSFLLLIFLFVMGLYELGSEPARDCGILECRANQSSGLARERVVKGLWFVGAGFGTRSSVLIIILSE